MDTKAVFIDLKHHPEDTWPFPNPTALRTSTGRPGHLVRLGVRRVVVDAARLYVWAACDRSGGIRDGRYSDQRGMGEHLVGLIQASVDAWPCPPHHIRADEIPVFVTDAPTLQTLAVAYFLWACWKEGRWISVAPQTEDREARGRHNERLRRLHLLASGGPTGLGFPKRIHQLYEQEPRLRLETCLEALEAWIDPDASHGVDVMTRHTLEAIAVRSHAGEPCGAELYAYAVQTARR